MNHEALQIATAVGWYLQFAHRLNDWSWAIQVKIPSINCNFCLAAFTARHLQCKRIGEVNYPRLKKRRYAMNALLTKASGSPANGRFISSDPRCIKVVFIFLSPIELQIKNHLNPVSMDTHMETQPEAARQTSSLDESPVPEPAAFTRPVPSPETGRATFANIRQETNLLDASMRALKQRKSTTASDLKLVAFSLNMPTAKRVQLSADFTDWDASPIDMIRFADGVWSTTVPLPSGVYAYHFLVDGNWHGDPQASPRESNSKGAPIAFIKVK